MRHRGINSCSARFGRQQHNEACCCLTYSSKKAWNNFWHFSANSSFTISPAFSAVAVATSMLKLRQTAIKDPPQKK